MENKKIYNFTTDKKEISELIDILWKDHSVVFTNGCFDLIHADHIHIINKSKKLGDILIVGMNSDKSVKLLKGSNRPIVNESDRAFILLSLASVDYLIIFDEYSVAELIEFIKPDIITKGSDYKVEQLESVGGKFMVENGKRVKLIPIRGSVSTSDLISKILKLNIKNNENC